MDVELKETEQMEVKEKGDTEEIQRRRGPKRKCKTNIQYNRL